MAAALTYPPPQRRCILTAKTTDLPMPMPAARAIWRPAAILISIVAGLLLYSDESAARPKPTQTPPGWPQVVAVPRLSVSAKIEPVAMTNPADSEAPHRMEDVAWYSRGHRPGDRGRAEVFGHLDSTCCPAVFYQLRTVKPGDLIQVRYKTGTPLT